MKTAMKRTVTGLLAAFMMCASLPVGALAADHTHRGVEVMGLDATCQTPGRKTYYLCIGCLEKFYEPECTRPVEDNQELVIPASPHVYQLSAVDESTHISCCLWCSQPEPGHTAQPHTLTQWLSWNQQPESGHRAICEDGCGYATQLQDHSLQYTAVGSALLQTCPVCDLDGKAELTYDASAGRATVTVNSTWVGIKPVPEYYQGDRRLLAAPRDPGSYRAVISVGEAAAAVDFRIEGELQDATPMYRLFNPNSGEHFYTGSLTERAALTAAGWNYEGIAWNAPTRGGSPVYRLFNPNNSDHHYTQSLLERETLVQLGWQYEGVAWNSGGEVPLYRLYNPNADCGSHHYTGSIEERDNLVALGWIFEGIGWYGLLK